MHYELPSPSIVSIDFADLSVSKTRFSALRISLNVMWLIIIYSMRSLRHRKAGPVNNVPVRSSPDSEIPEERALVASLG